MKSCIPAPKSCHLVTGGMELTPSSRIVARQKSLLPLGRVLAPEVEVLTALQLRVIQGQPQAGDICLAVRRESPRDSYELRVDDAIRIEGENCDAVATGSVTMLQTLGMGTRPAGIRRQVVRDEPGFAYRGLMVDLARNWHPFESLKQLVVLCRWYKINCLHLHLTDNESFTFPSASQPSLPTPGRHYSLDQLRELETFAADRGVTLVPELDVPGHARSLLQALPRFVGCAPLGTRDLCPGRESTYRVLDELIGEMCAVFRRSPWFHLGADESERTSWPGCRHCRAAKAQHGLADDEELYRHFLLRMHRIVRAHGKKTMVWEGFGPGGRLRLPRDITVMVFESDYHTAPALLADGYTVINTSWRPLYVCERRWPTQTICRWTPYRWESPWRRSKAYGRGIDITPSPRLAGAQMCSWGLPEAAELPSLRERLAAMSEKVWNPAADVALGEFFKRLEQTDQRLDKMLFTARPRAAWPFFALEPDS